MSAQIEQRYRQEKDVRLKTWLLCVKLAALRPGLRRFWEDAGKVLSLGRPWLQAQANASAKVWMTAYLEDASAPP